MPHLDVSTPSGGVIGNVKMRWAAFDQHLTIHDARSTSTTPICHIKRRGLPLVARGANEFKILDPSGKVQIGKVAVVQQLLLIQAVEGFFDGFSRREALF